VTISIIIPVKKLEEAKSRLSPLLSTKQRRQFCLEMLTDVLAAIKRAGYIRQTLVVSIDPTAHEIAKNFGAAPFKESRPDLNQAATEATHRCIWRGARSVLILPADIPLITKEDLTQVLSVGKDVAVVISPSRNMEGTNGLFLTPPDILPLRYGPRSFQRHKREALVRRLRFRVLKSPRIALDIDTIEDLTEFVALKGETHAHRFLVKEGIAERLGLEAHHRKVGGEII